MDFKTLIVTDPESDARYELVLNNEDNRAMEDEQYVRSLLCHGRVTTNSSTITNLENTEQIIMHDESENNPVVSGETVSPVIWSYNQTVCLITSMGVHYSDFNDPRKRKTIFEHIANDLISSGFTVSSIQVQNKWKSLMRSYHKAKDTKNRTGQGPPRFLFFELIDDILGDKPSNKCSHSLNSTDDVLKDQENDKPELLTVESEVQEVPVVTSESESNVEENIHRINRKRSRSSAKINREDYLQLKIEEYTKRQVRHEEKMSLEQEKLEMERRKLEILNDYITLRKQLGN